MPPSPTAARQPKKARTFVRGDQRVGKKLYEVRGSTIHSRGVFATEDIPVGARVIQYIGEKVTKAESERRGHRAWEKALKSGGGAVYLFTLNNRYDIDGAFGWNTARLINHSCDPNCEVHILRGKIWIIALRDISAGDEITFNYGFDLENYEDHPCYCGSKRCVGFIAGEEYWPLLKRKLKKKRGK